MKVKSSFAALLWTIFFIMPNIFAESDFTMSFTIDVPHDIALNHKSPPLADDPTADKNHQKSQPIDSFPPKMNAKKKTKAYSAVLLIKPVEPNSNWESEFSSIIKDNLVNKDSYVKIQDNHGLRKTIRKSEASHKFVVIPMANSVKSLKSLAHIIKSRNESSLFPEEMAMPKLEGIPEIIRIMPVKMPYRESRFVPRTKNSPQNLDSITKLNITNDEHSVKTTESSSKKYLAAPLFRKYILTRPSQPSTTESHIETLPNNNRVTATTVKTEETESILNTALGELENVELEKEIDSFLDDIDVEIVDHSSANKIDKKAPIDVNIHRTLSEENSGNESKFGIIFKLFDDIDSTENDRVVQWPDDNPDKNTPEEEMTHESGSRIKNNVVFLRLFPKFNEKNPLKPVNLNPEEHPNLFRSLLTTSLANNNMPDKIKALNVGFNGIIKTKRIPFNDNAIKFSDNGYVDSPTPVSFSNVLENYPQSLKYSPFHVQREVMVSEGEDIPKMEEIRVEKLSELIQQPVELFGGKTFPAIPWDEEIYNEIKDNFIYV
ncbi:uncharacterized protein [Parasteatoda tepidariorum]|uniref:uncharacterized protein n=1 Tax=Parasteatoda tepidariorum TaxID=114398 RepID=UPI001C71F77E|nr:uncharacterized protein LOC107441542 [Parasteatoda tepidariorum]